MKINFEKIQREARLLNPSLNFELQVQPIEFRKDPLTGQWCRINIERANRVKQAETKPVDISGVVKESKQKCFFCPENLEQMTPKLPGYPGGRIKVGSASVFPNLFPFGEFHAISIFSGDHYLSPGEFNSNLIEDCFKASLQYFNFIQAREKSAKYWTINWNFMPPAAASIVHPHLQILADHKPTCRVEHLLRESERYLKIQGSNYWADLVETEKKTRERWIGDVGSTAWLTSFAPQGKHEILAVFKGISSLAQLKDSGVHDFSLGLSRILAGYQELGIQSFNLTVFSGPSDQDLSKHYLLNAKILSRPSPKSIYTSDDGFMEKFHYEPVIETKPEDVAEKMRGYFSD